MHIRILVIRFSSLGDILLTLPVLDALRAKYPEATIDFLTKQEYAGLAKRFPAVNTVHAIDTHDRSAMDALHTELRNQGYTYVLDLHNNLRSSRFRKDLSPSTYVVDKRTFRRWLLVKFKKNLLKDVPDVVGRYFETAKALDITDTHEGAHFHTHVTKDGKVAFAPGAKHWNKRWPTERYIELAKNLTKKGYTISLFGSADELAIADEIVAAVKGTENLCGKYTIEELPEILAGCVLFVGNDSGLMHIAAAVGIPTVAIYGPTVREFGFMPRNVNVKILEVHGLDCRPCTTIGLDHCPKGHFRCMKETSSTDVLTALNF